MTTTSLLVLNGPNLGRLGSRQPDVYGSMDFTAMSARIRDFAAQRGFFADVRQTDDESELIGWLHEAVDARVDVILNPAAFTHYSYALHDAAVLVPDAGLMLVEVHITNPQAREQFRHTSVISSVASGVIMGFGVNSYLLAVEAIAAVRTPTR